MRNLYKKDQLIARLQKIAEKRLAHSGVEPTAAGGKSSQTPSVVLAAPRPQAARESTSKSTPAPESASTSGSAGTSETGAGQAPPAPPEAFDVGALNRLPPGYIVIEHWAKPDSSHNCPDGYPIKANANSYVYHLPDDPDYDRTIPEVCFANEEEARVAGFRPRLP